jgi:ABC-type transport system substrate-binding protein
MLLVATAACGGDEPAATTAAPTTSSTFPAVTGDVIGPTTTETSSTTTTRPPPPTTTLPVTDAEPAIGGEVVIASDLEPASLNPFAPGSEATAWDRIGQLHLVGIGDVAPSGELIPELLVELPSETNGGISVNDDGTMTVRFDILPEAVWSDGIPISGDDFLFTYRTLTGLEGFLPPAGADAGLYDRILPDSLVAGPKEFEFTMDGPTVQHELLFAVVIPAHQVAGTDLVADWSETPWVSGGPFVFESWAPGESMSFVRNENYWKTDEDGVRLPYLDRVEIRFFTSGVELVDAFRVRAVDVALPPPAVTVLDALSPLTAAGAGVFTEPGTIWEHLAFQFGERNRNGGSLNRFADFRRAIAHAVDAEALTASIYGGYDAPLLSYLDAYIPAVSGSAWAQYPYDPVEARRLLAAACEELGQPCDVEPPVVVFSTTSNGDVRVKLAALIEPMLADVGITVEMQLEDSSLFFGPTLTAGTWDLGLWAYPGAPGATGLVRAHDLFDPAAPPPFGNNYARWGTTAVEGQEPLTLGSGEQVDVNQGASSVIDASTRRFARIRRSMDEAVDLDGLAPLVSQAERILADEAVIIPLFARLWVGAVWLDEIAGYRPNVHADTWNVERWYRADIEG